MSAKTVKPAARASAAPAPETDSWTSAGKRQLAWWIDVSTVMFKGAEAMRRAQLNAAHLARVRHEEVAERLLAAQDLAGVMALQSELLRFDTAGATRYWQELFDLASRTGADMLGCAGRAVEAGEGEGVKSLFQALQGLSHTGIGTIDDLFGAPLHQAWRGVATPQGEQPAPH